LRDIHAALNKMHSQTSRPNIIQRTPAKLFTIHRRAVVFQQDLKTGRFATIGSRVYAAAQNLDGMTAPVAVRVTDNVCESLVNGASERSGFLVTKTHIFGQAGNRTANDRKDFGVAR
jgi:hypothetical protein